MPYTVSGTSSMAIGGNTTYSFIVIHDFYDTLEATSLFFKPIALRHDGCKILTFNYPGQANTVWPRPPPNADKRKKSVGDNGREPGPTPVLNNDWIADRVHELLLHANNAGDILLSKPFHILGIGNGACIAASFLQKWANHVAYQGLTSLVSINGFLCPDNHLAAILQSGTLTILSGANICYLMQHL